jgi:short-subunit dehydrogenase
MRSKAWVDRYGPWGLVAGASEGLGAAFARELALAGLDVVLVARREATLAALAGELRQATGRQVKTLAIDLASPAAASEIAEAVKDLEIGTLIYNAAFSPIGPFVDTPVSSALQAVDVNVRTPTALAHHLGQAMAARARGALVLLSSLTAFQGSPFVATYGATKSYNLSLAEGLWFELRGRGVDVLAVCAGATRTPNFLRAAPQGAPGMLEPEQVAREALAALDRGPLLIPGRFNRLASFLMRRVLPRRTTIGLMGDQTRRLQPGPR